MHGPFPFRYFLPAYAILVLLEAFWTIRVKRGSYLWKEALASLGVAFGRKHFDLLTAGMTIALGDRIYAHRLFTLKVDSLAMVLLLLLGFDLCFYVFHRLSHESRWFWATHAVHHSANQLNYVTTARQGWTLALAAAPAFFMPLVLLGFDPRTVVLTSVLTQLYSILYHTETIPKLGWLEGILVTPSHHRVHHAANPEYLDRNYASLFAFIDRIFGTYAEERDDVPCRFGLVTPLESVNPLRIASFEWVAMFKDLARARSTSELLRYAFGSPGWAPNGRENTSAVIRMRAEQEVSQ